MEETERTKGKNPQAERRVEVQRWEELMEGLIAERDWVKFDDTVLKRHTWLTRGHVMQMAFVGREWEDNCVFKRGRGEWLRKGTQYFTESREEIDIFLQWGKNLAGSDRHLWALPQPIITPVGSQIKRLFYCLLCCLVGISQLFSSAVSRLQLFGVSSECVC